MDVAVPRVAFDKTEACEYVYSFDIQHRLSIRLFLYPSSTMKTLFAQHDGSSSEHPVPTVGPEKLRRPFQVIESQRR